MLSHRPKTKADSVPCAKIVRYWHGMEVMKRDEREKGCNGQVHILTVVQMSGVAHHMQRLHLQKNNHNT